MFSARMDMFRKEPPVNASKKLNASPVCCANHCAKYPLLTPGTGSWEPILMTTSIIKVKKIRFRRSLILKAFLNVVSIRSPLLYRPLLQFFLLRIH